MPLPEDSAIRLKAFDWFALQCGAEDQLITRAKLEEGFLFDGQRVQLVGPQGIFKPRACDWPLTITSVAPGRGPYDDSFGPDGLIHYKYRGSDPNHHENRGLKEAAWRQIPLIYLRGIVVGEYLPVWPVFIVGADDTTLTFTVAVDDASAAEAFIHEEGTKPDREDLATAGRRQYITRSTRVRLHQRDFRERVLRAYRRQCTMCRLRHPELLDAAHIIADTDVGGEPLVTNGLALCKLHHAAFDQNFLGVSPDYELKVRSDLLAERDGPMLLHGLQGLHGKLIQIPRNAEYRPDRERLAERFERFKRAG